jgi:hypothetical protein
LRDAVRDLVAKHQKKILVNLVGVPYIDSSGVGELVASFTTVTNKGGQLKLLNLTKRVKDLLQITKLVRARARRHRNAARQISRHAPRLAQIVARRACSHSGPGPSQNEVQQRIAAMKARKPAKFHLTMTFYFDPTEPLRLIDPGKRDSTG